jgi:anaerobic selenocysteine-containing dehydrogenase
MLELDMSTPTSPPSSPSATVASVPAICPLDCPDACSLTVKVQDGRVVAVDGSATNALTAGFICAKVRRFPEHMYGPERVLAPAVRDGEKGSGRFRTVGWDEALARVAAAIDVARREHGGESILPLFYGGSNGYLTQDAADARLFRRLGSSRLLRTVCAAPSGAAAAGLYGKMEGVALPDYEDARLIVVWGANPTATGIHLGPVINRARRRGARLVVVDPRRTRLAAQADLHLPLYPGTDLPVALALINWLFENGAADLRFLAAHARGVEALRERARPWTFTRAAAEARVAPDALEAFARLYAASSPAVIRCGWGPERNRNGGSAVAAILALPAVAGKFGVRGGGYTLSNSPAFRSVDARGEAASCAPEVPSRAVNMNQAGVALTELRDPPIKVVFVYNGNPLATLPNQEKVRAGLRREDLFSVVFDAVWTDTARLADVILPATTFLEHTELARGYGAFVLHAGRPAVPPVGEARSNNAVFGDLVRRLGLSRPGDLEDDESMLAAVVASAPDGARLADELARDGQAAPTCGPSPVLLIDVFPKTPDQKIDLCPEVLDRAAPGGLYTYHPDPATPAAPLALISPAMAAAVSSTFAQLIPGQIPIELHPDDARARGIEDGDPVRAWNALGEVRCHASLNPDLRPGVALLPKGLWSRHTTNGATANALCPDALSDLGGGACFNDARIEVERAAK